MSEIHHSSVSHNNLPFPVDLGEKKIFCFYENNSEREICIESVKYMFKIRTFLEEPISIYIVTKPFIDNSQFSVCGL